MSKISPKNLAESIYKASHGKAGAELSQVLKNSAKMLAEKRLLGKSKDILKNLQEIIDKSEGIVRMKVVSAKALSSDEKKNLEHQTKEKYKAKSIVSEFFEDKEVLGGIRVEVGDEVMDNTWRAGLKKLEKVLIK